MPNAFDSNAILSSKGPNKLVPDDENVIILHSISFFTCQTYFPISIKLK